MVNVIVKVIANAAVNLCNHHLSVFANVLISCDLEGAG